MPYQSLEEVKNKLQSKGTGVKALGIPTNTKSMEATSKSLQANRGIRDVSYDLDTNQVYDRLNDGSYVAKFDSYSTGYGEEDKLAKSQSTGEKILYGLSKNIAKAGAYALDATVGTVYGLANGISKGSLSEVWDNDFSNSLDDFNKKLDYKLPNYYTDEEKSMNFLQSMGTMNFWFNDVAGGMAFVAGALLPELAIGAMTGGASLAVGAGKAAGKGYAKLLGKSVIGKALSKTDDAFRYSQGRQVIRQKYAEIFGKKAGDILSTAGFMVRTSNFEAGMEARHNFKEAMTSFSDSFEQKNGRQPTMQEYMEFTEKAKSAANGVYGANMAILGVSNAAMFGKAFDIRVPKIGKKTQNFFNRPLGLATKTLEDGTRVLRGANKAQKTLGTTYKILGKPAWEGLFEEGLQGVAGKTMQSYLEDTYDPNKKYTSDMLPHLWDSLAEQYGTKEGWKEIGIGMIIGFAGGVVQPGAIKSGEAFSGFGKNSRSARQAEIQSQLDISNKGMTELSESVASTITPGNGPKLLRAMNKASLAATSRANIESESFEPNIDNTRVALSFIQSQEHIKSSKEIQGDYNLIIDNTTFTAEQEQALEQAGMSVEQHKENLKAEFEQTRKDYNFARKSIEAIGLDRKLKDTPANLQDIGDAMMYNIVLGRRALANGQKVGKELDSLIGTTGAASYANFYNDLSVEEKQRVEELKAEKQKLKDLQSQALEQQNKLQGLSTRKTKETDDKLKKDFENTTALYVTTTQKVAETEKRITDITESLNKKFEASKYNLGEKMDTEAYTIADIVEQMDRIDTYVDALRTSGKNVEADAVEGLIEEAKIYHDFYREMVNTHRNMMETNYFSSREGKSLIDSLVGPRYAMSEDFKKIIQENNAIIDRSLGLVGVRGAETVEEIVQAAIQDNPNISEREKFRLESLIRLQLSATNIDTAVARLDAINSVQTQEKTNGSFIEGDTVQLKQKLDINKEGLSSQEILDKTIDKIVTEIDFLKNSAINQQKVARLEQELEELKAQRDSITEALEKEAVNTTKSEAEVNIEQRISELEKQRDAELEDLKRRRLFDIKYTKPIRDKYAELIQKELDKLPKATQGNSKTSVPLQVGTEYTVAEVVEVLDTSNPFIKKLFDTLKATADKLNVKVVFTNDAVSTFGAGIFDTATNTVRLHLPSFRESYENQLAGKGRGQGTYTGVRGIESFEKYLSYAVAHELIHSVTSKALIDVQTNMRKGKYSGNLSQTQVDAILKLNEIHKYLSGLDESVFGGKEYAFMNMHELLAEMSNEGFVGILRGLELPTNLRYQGKSVFENIVNALRAFFTGKTVENSAADSLFNIISDIVGNNFVEVSEANPTPSQPVSTTSTTQQVLDNLRQELETEESSEFRSQEVVDQLSGMIAILEGKQERESLPQSEPKTEEDSAIIQQAFENVFEEIPQPEGVTLFGDMTRGMDITLNRMEAGVPVTMNALKEVNDYLYQVYKNILSIKKTANTEAQASMGLTLAYLEQTQRQLEQTLNFIAEYETAFKSGANLPTFNVSPEGTVYEASTQGEGTNDGENQERDSQVERAIDKQQQDATQKSQEQEGTRQDSQVQPQGAQQGQQNQEQATEQRADVSNRNIRSKEDLDSLIAQKEKELETAKRGIRTIETEEYKRLQELTKMEQTGLLTESEAKELEELRDDIDKWFLASGTIVEGVRLSDLITQRATIETANVLPIENVSEFTEQEVIEQTNFKDAQSNYNSDLSLTYDSVTVKEDKNTGKLIISGIKPENISEVFSNIDGTPIDFTYEVDPQKNDLIIDKSELSKINTGTSRISINPTNQDTTSVYSVVMVWEQDINGNLTNGPLKNQFNDGPVAHNPQAIYNLNPGDKLILKIDSRTEWNQSRLDAYNNAKTKKQKAEALEALRREANISIYTEDGKLVGTLKGKRGGDVMTEKDEMFEMLRDQIFEDEDFVGQITGVATVHEITTKPISVKRILPGAPNLTMTKDADGEVAFTYQRMSEQDTKKVVDIGYIEDGKMVSRSKLEGVDGTFISSKRSRKGKTPFVVIQHGNRLLAYPVKLVQKDPVDLSGFREVFNSENISDVDKAIRLNRMLAAFGVNIKEPGKFFFAAGEVNNITEEFFNKMVGEVEQINYFYPLSEWVKPNAPIEQILQQQALINIDLSNPFHSPKVSLDFSEAFKDFGGKTVKSKTKKADTKEKTDKAKKKSNKPSKKDEAAELFAKLPEVGPLDNLPSTKDVDEAAKDNENKEC